jgi:cyclophilin family peptidyl-prolyl cis-trans isomerase
MSRQSGNGRIGSGARANQTKRHVSVRTRRLGIESLELRRLLSAVAPSIRNILPAVSTAMTTSGHPLSKAAPVTAATAKVIKSVSAAPSGYTIAPDQTLIGSSSASSTGFTFAGAATGTTYSYTINSSGGGTAVTGSGSVTSATQDITGINVSTLVDGTLTYSVTLANSAGAVGTAATSTATLFTALTVTSGTAESAAVGQVFTYTVKTNAPAGDAVTVTPGTTLPGNMAYSASTKTFTWTPTSDEVGVTQIFTVGLSDTIGNSPTVSVFVAVAGTSGVAAIAPAANIAIGSPVLVALNSADAGTPSFSVTTSSTADPTGADLTASFTAASDPVLQVVTSLGDMDFQLLHDYTPNTVAHFISLIDSGAYTNTSFYRIIQDFMSQGGSGGTGSPIPVELNPNLRFTSTGLLAMANNGVDGNSSEFFITNPSTSNVSNSDGTTTYADMGDGFLDFRYTIFGKLIAGDNVQQALNATPVVPVASGQASEPESAPVIESMSIITEKSDGVLLLSAQTGASGTYTVNVSDGLGGTTSFQITVEPNAFDPPNPWVNAVNGTDTITTAENTPASFTPQGESAVAAGSPAPQVNVQLFRPVTGVPNAYVDDSYVPTVTGQFELEEGTTATSEIAFNSRDPNTTAANIQSALDQLAGLSGTTVAALAPTPSTNPTAFAFTVTFAGSESPLTYSSAFSDLEANFLNSATTANAVQTLTFTYAGPQPGANSDATLTQNGSQYTVTPASGYQGIQFLEVTAVPAVTGTFELQVGTAAATALINFDSTNLAGTAAAMQSALRTAGYSSATVTAVTPIPTLSPTAFSFNVTFPGSEQLISLPMAGTLAATLTNSAVAASATQTVTLEETSPGTPWDAGAGISPIYTAFVPVFIGAQTGAPATPTLASINVGGKAVTGSTFANNATTASEFSFNITGATAGDTVLVYMDGGGTPIAGGTVATGATTITVTTNGTTRIADGNHTFTVKQATPEATLYADFSIDSSGNYAPGDEYSVPASSISSAASAGTTLTIGLVVLAPPASSVQAGVPYSYVVETNAPSGDTVTVTPVSLPAGMQFNGVNTFTWTPTAAQVNTSPAFSAVVSDSLGFSVTIGPVGISVIQGLTPVSVPLNAKLGGNVTVSFSGSQVEVYDNVGKAVLSTATFKSTDTVTIDLPAGQANSVSVVLPGSGAAIPREVLVQGVSGATSNHVTVVGSSGANAFTLVGGTVAANGLATTISAVQGLTLQGGAGNNYYTLNSSAAPLSIVNTAGYNTLDFSHDTAGVTVNLGLDQGQAQSIAPWSTTLSLYGVIDKLIGTAYADVLTGGPAATTEIVGGAGYDTITGGSGDNILMGGGGNDTIIGGRGKNLLIAGSGTCSLYANGSQNTVFAGSTNYDTNDAALMNLLAEGPQFMYSYAYRRALASSARNPAAQSSMITFQDSGAHDTIFGNSGSNNFFELGKNAAVKP